MTRTLAEVGGLVDEARLTLGIYGPDVVPDDITLALGVAPSRSHSRGDARPRGLPPYTEGAWLLVVEGRSPVGPEDLVHRLLDQLPSDNKLWKDIVERHSVRLSFGLFTGSWNRAFELSVRSLRRLCDLGLPVGFSIYADGDETDERTTPAGGA
jgi:hypothetical protein